MERGYDLLERKLGYAFRDRRLLETALTHKSYLNEKPAEGRQNNERLELLGDAVLGLCVAHLVMDAFPNLREGELSMTRARFVSEPALAELAAQLGLGDWLFLGRGEELTGGRRKPSLLADALEATVAAAYLDGGFGEALELSRRLFAPRLATFEEPGLYDFKTRLQERAQAQRRAVRYAVVEEVGPDHDKQFQVMVTLGDREYARCHGRSKKEAEQRAAQLALAALDAEESPQP